jgi:hypothetical protein
MAHRISRFDPLNPVVVGLAAEPGAHGAMRPTWSFLGMSASGSSYASAGGIDLVWNLGSFTAHEQSGPPNFCLANGSGNCPGPVWFHGRSPGRGG